MCIRDSIYKEDKRQGPSTILKNAMGIIIFVLLLIAFIAYNVFASSSHEFEDYNNDSAYTELSKDVYKRQIVSLLRIKEVLY